jgi:hypothetical protein
MAVRFTLKKFFLMSSVASLRALCAYELVKKELKKTARAKVKAGFMLRFYSVSPEIS